MSGAATFQTRLIASLDGHAREIDTTFATAGRHLGEGLGLFEALKERLAALSGELSGSEIGEAGATLSRLAEELRPLKEALAGETHSLQEIASHSATAGQALERLLEHMRLITILARSARIESVSVQGVGRDFGDFANEIVTLTSQAQRTIESCARDHHHLSALLTSALAAQRDFESRYGTALWALADKLGLTLAEVDDRQRRSLSLASEAAQHSGKIAAAAGGAIIALQSGDSIRQRLEHAIAGLRLGETMDDHAPGTGLAEAAPYARQVLHRLEAAQLEASAEALGEDAEAIERTLAMLQDDTLSLIGLVRSLYSGDGDDAGSFLAELESDLARASDLLGKCDSARAGIDRVAQALTGLLDTCQDTVEALAATVSNIVLIGMNAGLRAARIGTGGRSLVVIAQELKFAADLVAEDARRLTPTFERMQEASAGLKREDRFDAAHFAALDQAMTAALGVMRETAARLGTELQRLLREGGAFCSVVGQARLGFSNAGAMSDSIASAAHELTRPLGAAAAPDTATAGQVADWLKREIWPRYTMSAERSIHLAIVESCCGGGAAAVASPEPEAADALDDILF